VFENELAGLDAAGTLTAAEANEHTLILAEPAGSTSPLRWAAASRRRDRQSRIPGTEHAVRLGGQGTPTVGDFAPAELGYVLRISAGAACKLIADALDLRHRLKLVSAAVWAGRVRPTRPATLPPPPATSPPSKTGFVDARIAPSLGAVSWNRLQTLLEAAIYEADPDGPSNKPSPPCRNGLCGLGRSREHGLTLIIARAAAGDAIWCTATIDRIADILTRHGDHDPVDVRRSKAIGILAQPG